MELRFGIGVASGRARNMDSSNENYSLKYLLHSLQIILL
jgi:hypothetical protein